MAMEEEETISTELALSDLKKQSFRRTLDQLHDRASSILSLTLQWKDIEDQFDNAHNSIDQRIKEQRLIHNSIEHKLEEIKRREKDLETIEESVEIRVKEVEKREKEFELSQKSEIQERKKEIEWIQKSGKGLELIRDEIEKKLITLHAAENRFQVFNNCMDERARQVIQSLKEIEVKEREIEFKNECFSKQDLELREREKKLKLKFKEIELKEKQLEERFRELNEKSVVNKKNADLYFTVNMDGKALQIFLNELRKEEDSIRQEVFMALGLSSDPAKLVLDAMQGFYPPHLTKGDVMFKPEVIRRSCIILLEQLMKISPEISPQVRSEATKLSFNWMTKMKVDSEHSLEVLGFLHLVAAYGLASTFDADELLDQLEVVVHDSLAPGLFRALGLSDKIHGIIQNFKRKKQYIEAIRLVYAFELVNEFPPVPLLKDYLRCSKIAAKSMRKAANNSKKGQIEARNKRIADLRCAVRCIKDYKIEYGSSLGELEKQIVNLEKENSTKKAKLTVKEIKEHRSLKQKESKPCKRRSRTNKKKRLALSVATPDPDSAPKSASTKPEHTCIPVSASHSVPATGAESRDLSGTKRPWTDVSSKDDPNALHGAPQATSTVPSRLKLEQSSPGDLALERKAISPAPIPTSITSANTQQQQQQSENKRPRTHFSSDHKETYPTAYNSVTSADHTMQPFQNHPPATSTVPSHLKMEQTSPGDLALERKVVSPAPVPTSTTSLNAQQQQQSENKCPQTHSSSDYKETYPTTYNTVTSAGHSMHPLQNHLPATSTVPSHLKLEQSSLGDLALERKVISPASIPTSTTSPNIQLQQQQQPENKCPQTHISSDYKETHPTPYNSVTSAGHSMQPLQNHLPGLLRSPGIPYMHTPFRDHNLAGYPPQNMQLKSNNANASTVCSHIKLEQSSPGDLALERKVVSPPPVPTSTIPPNIQLQQQSENKHPQTHISSDYRGTYPTAYNSVRSAGHSMQPLQNHPPGLFRSPGIPYMHEPFGHNNLAGYPPQTMHLNSYNAHVMPHHPWNAPGNYGHY